MTGELFNPEAFEQIPGQIAWDDRTWDGEPLYSLETQREMREQAAVDAFNRRWDPLARLEVDS